jgi:succinate dehydrogenase/fumarate reductase iron-sulfur protein
MRVLEALDYIQEDVGDSIAYQWFCSVKKCGMCGVMVNGRQTLACWEPAQAEMVIEPLTSFPLIRDLVIDRDSFFEGLPTLDLDLHRSDPYPGFPEPLLHSQMKDMSEMAKCIECMLCISACPTYGSSFAGPAPLVRLAKYALDPRDDGNRALLAIRVGGIEDCVSCYQCTVACPMEIPILETAIEGLRAQIRDEEGLSKGLSLRDRVFANIHGLVRLGSATAPISNWMLGFAPTRWLIEKIIQIDRRHKLPEFAQVSFATWMKQREAAQVSEEKVILFNDTFMNFIEPEIGIAATQLLEASGLEVQLVEGLKCCGRPQLSKGLIEQTRQNAEYNVRLLAEIAEQGVPIVGCEPSCLLTLREEYPKLVESDAAIKVAAQCQTLEEFLAARAASGELGLKFTSKHHELLLHGHCHQKALVGMEPSTACLGMPKNFQVEEVPSTCCGMAGSNGYEREHYERSIEAGEVAVFPAIRNADPKVDIVAAGFSCRTHISHATGRQAKHPALILRDALEIVRENT